MACRASALALLNLLCAILIFDSAESHRCFVECTCETHRAACVGIPDFQSSSQYELSEYRSFLFRNSSAFRATVNFSALAWKLWTFNQHHAVLFNFLLICQPSNLQPKSSLSWMNRRLLISCIAPPHHPKSNASQPALIIPPAIDCNLTTLHSVVGIQTAVILLMSVALTLQCHRLTAQYRRRLRLFDRMRLVEEDLEDDGFEGDDLPRSLNQDLPVNLCLRPTPPDIRMTPADIDSDDADDENITTGSRISVACPDLCGLNIIFQRHIDEAWHKNSESGHCTICWAFNEHKHMRIRLL